MRRREFPLRGNLLILVESIPKILEVRTTALRRVFLSCVVVMDGVRKVGIYGYPRDQMGCIQWWYQDFKGNSQIFATSTFQAKGNALLRGLVEADKHVKVHVRFSKLSSSYNEEELTV